MRRIAALIVPLIAMLVATVALTTAALAEDPVFQSRKGVALKGYDPVAYHTSGGPQKGQSQHSHKWMGATWYFASAENRDLFAADPDRYAPRYGGYCAWAVSQGYTASTDPDAWDIIDGKLYLNYSKGVQRKWRKDIPGFIRLADENWPGIKAK